MIKSIYIHIPFCHKICTYCDFNKLVGNNQLMTEYITTLIKEISQFESQLSSLKTIHIGGGTPSALPLNLLDLLLSKLDTVINLNSIVEFGFEANPNDISIELVSLLKKYHVNRISLGVESSFNHHLRAMNRSHDVNQVIRAVEILNNEKMLNYNLDFIYAWPKQTFEELKQDLDFAISLKPKHLSFYALILEPKTKLYHDYMKKQLELVDEETDASMYEYLREYLAKFGYHQYEISNFAQRGYESEHNLSYWQIDEYLGVGMGAHSQTNSKRFHNYSTIKDYLNQVNVSNTGVQSEDECDLMQETFIMGLRLNQGVSITDFKERFHADPLIIYPKILQNIDEKLVVIEQDRIKLTPKGQLLLNYVERSFI